MMKTRLLLLCLPYSILRLGFSGSFLWALGIEGTGEVLTIPLKEHAAGSCSRAQHLLAVQPGPALGEHISTQVPAPVKGTMCFPVPISPSSSILSSLTCLKTGLFSHSPFL